MMNSGNILMRLMIVVWRWFGLLRVSRVCSLVSCCSASSIFFFEVHAPCFSLSVSCGLLHSLPGLVTSGGFFIDVDGSFF